MKLDIMTLMAASAAVTESPAAATEGLANQPGADGVGESEEGSFISILQSLATASSEVTENSAALLATSQEAAANADTALEALDLLQADAAETAQAAMPQPLWLSGETVPASGTPLPLSDADAGQDTAVTGLQRIANAAAATQTPAATALTGDTVDGAEAAASAPLVSRAAGWYSRTADAAAPTGPVLSSDGSAVDAAGSQAQRDARQSLDDTPLALRAGADRGSEAPATARAEPSALSQLTARFADALGPHQAIEPGPDVSRTGPMNALQAPATAQSGPANTVDRLPTVLSVQQPGWDRALAEQLTVMAGKGVETAELKLDPPTLGTVHVKLTLQGDQAQLLVQSANGAVRDLMESALPRLRELLGNEGVSLDSAQVADREQAQRQEREARERPDMEPALLDETLEEAEARIVNDTDLTLGPGRLHIRV